MVRIAISQAAFDVIASTMTLGSVGFENAPTPNNVCKCPGAANVGADG